MARRYRTAMFRVAALLCLPVLLSCPRSEPASPLTVSASALAPMNPRTPDEAPPRHVLLTVEVGPAGMRVLESRNVDAPMPIDRSPERAPWRVRVEDASGGTLWVGAVEGAGVLRGEFAGPDGSIESVHVTPEQAVLPVRIPILAGAKTIRLFAAPSKGVPPGEMVELGHAPYLVPAP